MFLKGQCKFKRWIGCLEKKAKEQRRKDRNGDKRNWFVKNADKLFLLLSRTLAI